MKRNGIIKIQNSTLNRLLLVGMFSLAGCAGSGPTSRSIDGDWSVSENICSSDPAQPDLSDMRSEIRQKTNGTSADRTFAIFHLDKTIVTLENTFSRNSVAGTLTTYENSPNNPILETKKARNSTEINNGIKQAVVDFFKDDAKIDGKKATSFCLFRGQ